MRLHLYLSALCPRCIYTAKIVKKLQDELCSENGPDSFELVFHDIATDFKSFKEAGIRMIPTLACANAKKSWLLPKEAEIRAFILENREK